MSKCTVYEHWRLDRDECFYVGIAKSKGRPFDMKKRNMHHKAIVAKSFREGFGIEVRIVVSGISWEQACEIEIQRIAFWRKNGVDLANIASGGNGCILFGELNHQYGKESYFKGKKHSDETKAKISQKMSGNKNQTNRKYKSGNQHPFFGKKHSEETILKMRESRKLRLSRESADQTVRADAVQIDRLNLAQEE